ncbi:hypothetical protein, partial [Streptomyces rubiginosohelvolus]
MGDDHADRLVDDGVGDHCLPQLPDFLLQDGDLLEQIIPLDRHVLPFDREARRGVNGQCRSCPLSRGGPVHGDPVNARPGASRDRKRRRGRPG